MKAILNAIINGNLRFALNEAENFGFNQALIEIINHAELNDLLETLNSINDQIQELENQCPMEKQPAVIQARARFHAIHSKARPANPFGAGAQSGCLH